MRYAASWFVATCLILPPLIAYLVWGRVVETEGLVTLGEHLLGIFRHGNLEHLFINVGLLAVGGGLTASRIGAFPTLAMAAVFGFAGTLAEWVFVGPGFVGASGVAYGLLSYWMIASSPEEGRIRNANLVVFALLAEALLLTQIAVLTHTIPGILGGGLAMLSIFGPKGPSLVPMKWEHISSVLSIIAQTDEDDAKEAEESFLEDGYDNMFVVKKKGKVIAVTGYSLDESTPDLAWLSWTYVDEAEQGQGTGSFMINEVLGRLAKLGIRKAFIESSDYAEDGRKIYAAAHKLYEDFGANLELTVPNYHAPGEAKLIFGIDNPEAAPTAAPEAESETGLRFEGYDIAPETDDVAGLRWVAIPIGVAGLQEVCSQCNSKCRMAVFTVPSDLTRENRSDLTAANFELIGALKDYYGTGLNQEWWAREL